MSKSQGAAVLFIGAVIMFALGALVHRGCGASKSGALATNVRISSGETFGLIFEVQALRRDDYFAGLCVPVPPEGEFEHGEENVLRRLRVEIVGESGDVNELGEPSVLFGSMGRRVCFWLPSFRGAVDYREIRIYSETDVLLRSLEWLQTDKL